MNGRAWELWEDELLRELYPHVPTFMLGEEMKRTCSQIHARSTKLGLRKTEKFLASKWANRMRRGDNVGVAFRFKKGIVPANKGLRRPGWTAGRMAETMFKKGRPAVEARNYVPIGTEKIDPKRKVLMRKVTDDPSIFPVKRWRPVHVMVWEAANGPVPHGHIVRFRHGMKVYEASLITVDRLELVTLAENMRRNTLHRYPKEIVHAVYARGRLVRSINRRQKDAAAHD